MLCKCSLPVHATFPSVLTDVHQCQDKLLTAATSSRGGWGGGGALMYRGGPYPRYVFRGRRGLLLRPPHVCDFVKEGYFFVPRIEVWGSKSPYNPRNIRSSAAE